MSDVKLRRIFIALLTTLALVLSACGDSTDTTTTTEAAAAAAVTTTEAPAVTTTAPAVEEPTTTTMAVQALDIVAVGNGFLSTLPDGFNSAGDVAAFKEAADVGGAFLIDVRQPSEYEEGHIPGAINIPLREITKHLDEIPTDGPVIVYCKSGYRAALAMSGMQMLGFDNVKAFSPSYAGWVDAGEEVSTEIVMAKSLGAVNIDPDLIAAVEEVYLLMPEGYLGLGTVEAMQGAIEAGAFIIDVRQPSEYAEGHIPGAVNIPLRELVARIDEIPTDTQVIVYCKSGYRAALAGSTLNVVGLDNTRIFPPSWNGWTGAGLDVEI